MGDNAEEAPAEPQPEEPKPEEPAAEPPPEEPPKEEPKPEHAEQTPAPVEEKRKESQESSGKAIEKPPSKTSRDSVEPPPKKTSSLQIDKKDSAMVSSDSFDSKKRSEDLTKDDSKKIRQDRLSRARSGVHSIISIRRLSLAGDASDKKGARYMNSYKLDSDRPFNPDSVKKILEVVMVEAFDNLTYDADKCPKLAKWASSAIRARVKELQFDRYKIVCLVTIGEKNAQDVLVTCRFLWDVDRDRYATFSLENTYVFGIAQCFGLYYE